VRFVRRFIDHTTQDALALSSVINTEYSLQLMAASSSLSRPPGHSCRHERAFLAQKG
jgi:hypothetical protein